MADHPASQLFDAATNTDWQGTGQGADDHRHVQGEGRPGGGHPHIGSADAFVDTRRPAEVPFAFSDGTTKTIKLEDVTDKQTFDLSASNTDSVVITVTSTNGPESAPISISEIEFFKKD